MTLASRPWPKFALVGLFTGLAAYMAFAAALAGVAQTSNADLALRFSSNDPVALAVKADQMLANATSRPPKPGTLLKAALRSLNANPTNARAVRLVGIAYGLLNNPARAARLYGLANQISRRDLGNQLLLIEGLVDKGDAVGALKHYDIVLRTSPSGQATLFPILFSAMDDPTIRAEVSKLIGANPPWLKPFLSYALAQNVGLANVADTVIAGGGLPTDETFAPYQNALLARLIDTGQFAALERYGRSVKTTASSQLTSVAFRPPSATARFQPLAWQLSQDNGVTSHIETEKSARGALMNVFAAPDNRWLAARKLLFVTSGMHTFKVEQTIVETGNDAEVQWQISCAQTQAVLWASDRQNAAGHRSIRQSIFVPDGCRVLWISVIAAGGASENGMEMVARSIALTPATRP